MSADNGNSGGEDRWKEHRDALGRFVPGNPGGNGRPKRKTFKQHVEELLEGEINLDGDTSIKAMDLLAAVFMNKLASGNKDFWSEFMRREWPAIAQIAVTHEETDLDRLTARIAEELQRRGAQGASNGAARSNGSGAVPDRDPG